MLFSRDCSLYYVRRRRKAVAAAAPPPPHTAAPHRPPQPCGAGVCAGNKAVTGLPFDHAGVVVMWQGFPMLAEWTFGGVKVRPFDERIKCSRAREVVVRPLARPLSGPAESALKRTVAFTSQTSQGTTADVVGWLFGGRESQAPGAPPSSPSMPGWKPRPTSFGDSSDSAEAWAQPPPEDGGWQDVERHTRATVAVGVRDVPPALRTASALASLALGKESNPAVQYVATLYAAAGVLPGTQPAPASGAGVVSGIAGTDSPLHVVDGAAVQRHSSMTTWARGGIDSLGACDEPVAFSDAIVFRDTL